MSTPDLPSKQRSELHDELNAMEQQHPLLHFLTSHSHQILWTIPVILLLFLCGYYFFASGSASTADFVRAEREFALLEKEILKPNSEESALNTLTRLASLLDANRELQAKYDGLIGQRLLSAGLYEKALPYAERVLKRTGSQSLPHFADFGRATVLIAEGQEENAKQLTLKLSKESEENALSFFNTLRMIAIETGEEQKATLDALKQKIQAEPHLYERLIASFQEGELSFSEYLNHI